MTSFIFTTQNVHGTDRLGAALAELLPSGTTVALCGTLGAGKTRLVQAIAAGCGIDPAEVTSPTFVLCQEYHGRRSLFHFDAYRLNSTGEFLALGPEEYFQSPGLTLIEWADRVETCLPTDHLVVEIEVQGDTARSFHIHSKSAIFRTVIDQLRTALDNA